MYANGNKRQSEMTARPSKYPQGFFKQKPCRECGKVFSPQAPSHSTCSQECADRRHTSFYLQRNYKITLTDYERMLAEQGSKCRICLGEGFVLAAHHKAKLVVDHCHATGVVRGLLCPNCNRALGLLQDSTEALKRALHYLEGATTIPQGSTPQAIGGGSARLLATG